MGTLPPFKKGYMIRASQGLKVTPLPHGGFQACDLNANDKIARLAVPRRNRRAAGSVLIQ